MMCVNAQVTIGSTDDPHANAILDLKSTNKGLLLPNVELDDVSNFKFSKEKANIDSAKGMIVFNTNANIKGGSGAGVYVWDGAKWMSAFGSRDTSVSVTSITVTGPATATVGTPVTMIANVLPANATDKTLTWSVTNGTGKATINETTGILSGTAAGTVTVKAIDASGMVSATYTVTIAAATISVTSIIITGPSSTKVGTPITMNATILPSNATNKTITWSVVSGTATIGETTGILTGNIGGTVTVTAKATDGSNVSSVAYTVTIDDGSVDMKIGKNTYKTIAYKGSVWMVQNSKEGTSSAQSYPGEGSNGYYYTSAQAASACPAGWHLPTSTEWSSLITWVNANKTDPAAAYWVTDNAYAGFRTSDGVFFNWSAVGYWWSGDANHHYSASGSISGPHSSTSEWRSVRCVQD